MKRISGFLALAALAAFIITGCKGKGSVANDPKTVLTAFFERMGKKDLDGAAKLATKESKSTIDMMKKGMEAAEKMKGMTEKDPTEEFKSMKFGEAKIDGDNATVAVTNTAKGNNVIDFPLKKEDGNWKVDFSMSTLMKMGKDKMGDAQEGLNDIKDLDKMVNSDSLGDALEKAQEALKNIKPEDLEKAKEMMKNIKPEDIEKAKEMMKNMKQN